MALLGERSVVAVASVSLEGDDDDSGIENTAVAAVADAEVACLVEIVAFAKNDNYSFLSGEAG